MSDYFPYGKVLRHYNVTEERFLTTQHERDQETGLDYRGARYYDNEVGRFLSLDPKANEYPSLSDYVYVGNNPIAFIDPDGKKFIIPEVSQREQILGYLNQYSQHTYAVNDKGVIYVSEWDTNENGSEYFSDRMQQAINSDKVTEIIIYDKVKLPAPYTKNGWLVRGALPDMWDKLTLMEKSGKTAYVNLNKLGGATFKGKNNGGAKNNIVYIKSSDHFTQAADPEGKYDSFFLGYFYSDAARVLMHELIGHAIPEMIGGDTGNASKNENKVIEEVNANKADEDKQPIRKIDGKHVE